MLAIHVDSVVPHEVFSGEVDRYVRDIRETYEPLPGYDRALLPGAIEAERMAQHRRDGIPFGEEEQNAARHLHDHFGVPLPW